MVLMMLGAWELAYTWGVTGYAWLGWCGLVRTAKVGVGDEVEVCRRT